jgi:hypothetical protein
MNDREYRRERVLDQAIASGKFPEARRQHYRNSWDRDPAGTEQVIAGLVGVPLLASIAQSEAQPQRTPDELDEQVALAATLYPELRNARRIPHGGTAAPAPEPTRAHAPPRQAQEPPPPSAPASAASAGGDVVELRPEIVDGWTEALYPEVWERKASPQQEQRIFRCND